MLFFVDVYPPPNKKSAAYLYTRKWDDWAKYSTLYILVVFDSTGVRHEVGEVKVGRYGMMPRNPYRPEIPGSFDSLSPDVFFSVGQSEDYYINLSKIGNLFRERILVSLCDMAFNADILERAKLEDVTGESLLRYLSLSTVEGQFNRLAHGGERLVEYDFCYTTKSPEDLSVQPTTLGFIVVPESHPPSNIHVIIGRNGVGKTRLLNHMARSLLAGPLDGQIFGHFESRGRQLPAGQLFANLVSVAFSAFDPFDPPVPMNKGIGTRYAYIGLKKSPSGGEIGSMVTKSTSELAAEFANSASACRIGKRMTRWHKALTVLESDPMFASYGVTELAQGDHDQLADSDWKKEASDLFDELSSGHKIVLLTITRLIETVEERTLVLIDEPEAYLHPPLLAAFVRAISDLLIDRNGVAIIATHSPVVLQEVPSKCVWKISRADEQYFVERPELETFGENIGVLTREIFGLEVKESGFHKMLKEALEKADTYEGVLAQFSQELGSEAKAIVRALLANPESKENI